MLHSPCYILHVTYYIFNATRYMRSDSTCCILHFTLHTSPFTRHWGCCCFFNKQKPRNSTFFDRLHLASLELDAVLRRCPRRLRKSRLKTTCPVIAAALYVMINFQALTLHKRRQMHIKRLHCTTIVSISTIMSN